MAISTKSVVLAAVVAAAASAAAVALMSRKPPAAEVASMQQAPGQEECFGVAKAGENDCAAANGAHTCGGLAKTDYSGQEFKNVDAGTCVKMGGKLEAFDSGANPAAPKAQ
ncbi:MAG: BufA1 family periplasmic bufferin-type metallophore [Rhodospirillaceae bacterium]